MGSLRRARTPFYESVKANFILLAILGSLLIPGSSQDEVDRKSSGQILAENDTFDLDPKGNCSEDINIFCTPPKGKYLDCIMQQLLDEQAGVRGPNGREVAPACKMEIRTKKIQSYKDLTLDKKLDIQKTCSDDNEKYLDKYLGQGGILACLRDNKDALSEECQNEVYTAEREAAFDIQMDPALYEKCSKDALAYCADVSPAGGRIQACLRSRSAKVTYPCRAELFRQEQENSGDLRLNVELYKACESDKQKFCPNVRPGNARIKDCLESFRLDPGFSQKCKVEFDKMLERRSEDFRLDPELKSSCESDMIGICGSEYEDITEVAEEVPRVLHCLQDHRDDLKDPQCKKVVHKALVRAAEDYRFDSWFAKSCEASKESYCKEVDNGKVLQCLQGARELIDQECRSAVFEMEWRLSGDIDYKVAMKEACGSEIPKFCRELRHDKGVIVECLQQNVDDPEMGETCKKEVLADEVESAKDYRLNYRVYENCFRDVRDLCPVSSTCPKSDACGGRVLKCLQDNMDQIKSGECLKDVFSFTVKEAKNPELNIPLQKACQEDITKYCGKVPTKDHSKTLMCLRTNRNKLANSCKVEELRFSMMEVSDIRLTPSLMNACAAELGEFCSSVSPANGEAFKCLQMHLVNVEMGTRCKIEVDLQEARQASDYRLDVRVRSACQADVNSFCGAVDPNEDGHAPVLKCFVAQFQKLSGKCQTEVAYSVRMALWQYQTGSDFTSPCDESVKQFCDVNAKPIDHVVIGTYGQCLTSENWKKLSGECRALVQVATKDGSYVGDRPEVDMAAAIAELKELKARLGDSSQSSMGFFWISTVVAFVALLAVAIFRKYSGPPKAYTLVVKGGDV